MKCSRCGYIARSLPGMSEHYRKKHPAAMKVRAPRSTGAARGHVAWGGASVKDGVYHPVGCRCAGCRT